jgi:hypothetical protein
MRRARGCHHLRVPAWRQLRGVSRRAAAKAAAAMEDVAAAKGRLNVIYPRCGATRKYLARAAASKIARWRGASIGRFKHRRCGMARVARTIAVSGCAAGGVAAAKAQRKKSRHGVINASALAKIWQRQRRQPAAL